VFGSKVHVGWVRLNMFSGCVGLEIVGVRFIPRRCTVEQEMGSPWPLIFLP
jgi:hypothetical protein